jgi:hypothetical protein
VLVHEQLTGESMKRYIRVMDGRAALIWHNKNFRLYRIKPFNPAGLY